MNALVIAPILSALSLLVLGVGALYSATLCDSSPARFNAHLLWIGLGAGLGLICALANPLWLRKWRFSQVLMILTWLLLIAVLIPGIGVQTNGARRWLPLGGQPSELAKLSLVLMLADYCAARQESMRELKRGFLWPGSVIGLTALLVFLEPDWGTAVLLAVVGGVILLLAGSPATWTTVVGLFGGWAVATLAMHDPVRLKRILSFLDPEKYADTFSFQVWHSMLAIASGGLMGTSLGGGSHRFGFVPEQQTDFILSLIGEELGLAGTSTVLILFASLIWCGLRIAWLGKDLYSQLLAAGLTLLIGIQACLNIAVVTSSLPNKGIPLPLVSYGGSSMVSMLAAVGLLIGLARRATRPLKDSAEPGSIRLPGARYLREIP